MSKTIDITPTWRSAVHLYVALLMDPGVDHAAKMECKRDLLRLAEAMDASNAEAEHVCWIDDTSCGECGGEQA